MYKGAIIGFGKIARTNHLSAYNSPELKDKIEITSIVEQNKTNYEQSRMENPSIRFYKTIEDLFKNEKPDFADIATPPAAHYEIMKKCIANDVHIICEKPFTLIPGEAEEIKRSMLNSDKTLFLCHQYKYSPLWKKFKEFADSAEGRTKVLLQFNVLRTEADPGLKLLSNSWRTFQADIGGGILADTGVHYLYLAMWMLGQINSVTTKLLNLNHKEYNSEDTALIILEGKKGTAQITLTWGADRRYNSAFGVCGHSSIFYENDGRIVSNSNKGKEEFQGPDASDKAHYTSLYIDLFKDFIASIEGKIKNTDRLEEACRSVSLMNACYQSAIKGVTIRINNEE